MLHKSSHASCVIYAYYTPSGQNVKESPHAKQKGRGRPIQSGSLSLIIRRMLSGSRQPYPAIPLAMMHRSSTGSDTVSLPSGIRSASCC